MMTKRCSRCRQSKAVLEFYKNRTQPDGIHNQCKQCSKEVRAKYRKNCLLDSRHLDGIAGEMRLTNKQPMR